MENEKSKRFTLLAKKLYEIIEEKGDTGIVAHGMMPKELMDIIEASLEDMWKQQEIKLLGAPIPQVLKTLGNCGEPIPKEVMQEIDGVKRNKKKWIDENKKDIHIAVMKEARKRKKLIV